MRYTGFRDALSDAGLAFHSELVIDAMGGDMADYRRGFEGMLRLLDGRGRPDGVMTYNDTIALGGIDAALSRGIKIPDAIALVGSGNDSQLCEMRVPLSSVAIPGQEVGQKAGRMALQLVTKSNGAGARRALVSPKLIERSSSRRLRS
jgi:DNA-binding LacI/PurR family transcriptional regulator